jgi:hypothetical protein
MTAYVYCESIVVDSSPETLYDMVADVTRMGEWSPICKACWWDDGATGQVGDWFTGRNEEPERTWDTRSEIVVAERGRGFAFVVGGSYVLWSYAFEPVEEGTEVTEAWELLPAGLAMFSERFGEDAQIHIDNRVEAAHTGIPATLAALKEAAEST